MSSSSKEARLSNWRFEANSKVCLKKHPLNIYLASQFKVKDLDLEYFLFRFLGFTLYQEVPKLYSQQELRGLVDKTTAQQTKVQQFETDSRQGLGFIIFC